MAPPAVSDEAVEHTLSRLLQLGVLASACVVLAGGVLYLIEHGAEPPHHETFTGEPTDLTHVFGIVKAAAAGRGRGLIQLGLLILIATPVSRVAFALYAFARQRDRTYVVITAFVLALLIASLVGLTP